MENSIYHVFAQGLASQSSSHQTSKAVRNRYHDYITQWIQVGRP